MRGEWVYLYRAVDKAGKTVDFYLSPKRDVNAAKAFLRKAIKGQRTPAKITLDACAASYRAVADLKQSGELAKRVRVRSNKYLNNTIEQDHRRVKQRLGPMLGLQSFQNATVAISGIELVEKIKKASSKSAAGRTDRDDAGNLGSGLGRVSPGAFCQHDKSTARSTYPEFAPEPLENALLACYVLGLPAWCIYTQIEEAFNGKECARRHRSPLMEN